jgi:predicted DCC family thiol-disulfide oxidoreductase YuxK
MRQEEMAPWRRDGSHPGNVILVDGTCVFCNHLVRWILRRDKTGFFRFAHIQGQLGRAALARHGADPNNLDGVYVLVDAGANSERLLVDGQAARVIWPRVSRLGVVVRFMPLVLLNLFYRLFARVRYRLFGRFNQCSIPTEAERARFLE